MNESVRGAAQGGRCGGVEGGSARHGGRPLATQQAIVAEIEEERALVEANRALVARFEGKIAAALARVWGGG